MREQKIYYSTFNNYKLCGIINNINDNKEIVVICHARTSSKDSRATTMLANELTNNNVNNFRFDFLFCGESDGDYKEYTVSKMIKNLEDTLDMLTNDYGYTKFILAGCSMGGRIVSLIDHNRYNVEKLILWYPALDLGRGILNLPSKRERIAKKQGYCQIEKGIILGYEYFKDERRYKAYKNLYSLDIPLLFIHGTGDPYVSYKSSIIVSKKCKNAKLVLINGGDHGFHNDDNMKEALNNTLAFIKGEII